VANQLIIKEFDTANERGAIDGVVSHIYSTTPDNIDSQYFDFQIIEKTWREIFDGLTNYVTEWNLRSNTSVLAPADFTISMDISVFSSKSLT
jgi:hypothetical protein